MSEIEAHHKERLHVGCFEEVGLFHYCMYSKHICNPAKTQVSSVQQQQQKKNTLRVTEFPSVEFTATSGRLRFSASLCFDSK